MTDRRSFSEIPADVLRDHGADDRVDRVWQRVSGDLASGRRSRRPAWGGALALSGVALFSLGVFVGVRWSSHEPAPLLAAFGAEPTEAPRLTVAPALGANAASEAAHDAPRSPRARRVIAAARRVDAIATEPAPAPPAPPVTSPVEWQRLADEGQYSQSLAALEASGGFDAALRDATAEQLMSLVDVARATGQRDRAIVALRRIVSEHGADPNAPVAAWMLGNELSKTHDAASAEQAFAMYRALSPGGDFAEDALARQIEMAAEQGHGDHARRLAEQYLKEFPDGPRTADIQAELEQWAHEPSLSASAEPPARESAPQSGVDAGVLR